MDLRKTLGNQAIVVVRSPELESRQHFRPRKECDIECLAVVVGEPVLHRLLGWRSGGAPVADLGYIVKPQVPGRDNARRGKADVVDRQDATIVLKLKNKWPVDRSLHPGAVVIGRIVKTDGRVVPA